MSVLEVVAQAMSQEQEAPAPVTEETPVTEQTDSSLPEDLLNDLAPAPAPAEKKPDDDALEVEKLIESDEPPKEKKAWAKTKHELKTYKDKVKELEEKLGGQKLPEETIKQYEDRLAEMDQKISQLSLVESEAFKREYDSPIHQNLGRAVQLMEQHGGKSREDAQAIIQRASRMPFADRNRFLMDEAPELAGVVNTILLTVDEKVQVRSEAIKQAQATKAALQESEKRTSQVQNIRSLEQHLGKAVEDARTAGNPFFRRSNGTTPDAQLHNQAIDLNVEAVKQIMLKGDQAEIARLVTDGYTTRRILDQYAKALAENRALKAQLNDTAAVRPTIRGGAEPQPAVKEVPKGLGVEGMIGAILQQRSAS